MTDKYAVMGNPIGHSKSPFIHTAFASQTGQDISYSAILADVNDFAGEVARFKASSGKGLNVTVPFKEDAWNLVDQRSTRAEKAGAVNTISITPEGLIGDNTDGVGIVRDLQQNNHVPLVGKKILVLGAGGAVRGILQPVLEQKPANVVVANRTVSKAEALVEIFHDLGNISAVGFADVNEQFDVIINGTAASLNGEMPPISDAIADGAVCYDMMYSKDDTVFTLWAKQNGAVKVLDGLGMLVEQAAESFYIWRQVRPDTLSVIAAVRESFN